MENTVPTNIEIFKVLSQQFIKQKQLREILNCSQSHISKVLCDNKIINEFGLGYPREAVIKTFGFNLTNLMERVKFEREINL